MTVHFPRLAGQGKGSHTPTEAADSLFSNNIAHILDILSEGEIEGIVGGEKGIFYNEVPLLSDDGTKNFEGVIVVGNNGTPDQVSIPGFDNVRTSVAVGQDLSYNVYKTISFPNGGDITSATVTISATNFFEVTKDGDTVGTTCSFVIERSQNGGAFEVIYNGQITGKQPDEYTVDYRIPITDPTGNTAIRVKRTKVDTTSLKVSDAIKFKTYTKIVEHRFSYPNLASYGHIIDAKQFGNQLPSRQYHARGILCRIPHNYDPVTRAYNGPFNGTMTAKIGGKRYTNNPVYIFYEIVTNKRYGLGKFFDETLLDIPSLYMAAKWCDELVSDGRGGMEPRWTCNTVINTRGEAYNLLKELVSAFRGSLFWMQAKLWAVGDQPREPVKLVTNANVIGGKFTYSGESNRKRYSVYNISWNDPDLLFRRSIETVEDPQLIREFGYKPTDYGAFACSSPSQARRVGLALLYAQENEDQIVSYKASFDHMAVDGDGPDGVAPGDLVLIADKAKGNAVAGGRIKAARVGGLTLDRDAGAGTGSIWVEHTTGGIEWLTCVYNGADITLTEQPKQAIEAGDVFILLADGYSPEPFVVLKITEEADNIVGISAVKYDEGRYAAIYGEQNIDPKKYMSLPSIETVQPVASVSFKETYITGVDVYSRVLDVSWPTPEDPLYSYVAVSYSKDNDNWTPLPNASGNTVRIMDARDGVYRAQVAVVNRAGISSKPFYAAHTIGVVPDSDVLATGTITNLVLQSGGNTFGGRDAKFSWTVNTPQSDYMQQAGISATTDVAGLADPLFRDCVVTVRRSTGEVLRIESVVGTSYVYTFEKNFEDTGGAPVRSFSVGVQYRDTFGSVSPSVQIGVTNPAPVFASDPVASAGLDTVHVSLTSKPDDLDYVGVHVYMTANDPPALTPDNLKYSGTETDFFIKSLGAVLHRLKVVPYDAFGEGTPSSILAASPYNVMATIATIQTGIADLVETYGATAAAAQSADLAAQHEANALIAQNASQSARDAAQYAQGLATTQAGIADTARKDAQAANTAAAAASAQALTQAGLASTARSDAQSAYTAAASARDVAIAQANNAQTQATNAQVFSSQASDHAQSALAASASASSASGIATQAKLDAQTYANSASGFASQASSSATVAGQAATSASIYRDAAQTAQGGSESARDSAATSATNAAGSASSASQSAGVSATAATAAQAIADRLYPKEINPQTLASFVYTGTPTPYLAGPDPSWPQPYMLTHDTVGPKYIHHKATHNKIVGQRMRITCWVFTYSPYCRVAVYYGQSPSYDLSSGGTGYNPADGTTPAGCYGSDVLNIPVQQFVKFGREVTISADAQAFIYPEVYINPGETGTPANARTHIAGFIWEDVTSETAAQTAASAAATSASNAAASNTAAGQQASAAQQSATNANTYAGQANTYASQASQSASNAAGSSTTASQQAGIATSAATNANTYRDQSLGYANSAAGSASQASSSATTAGQQATAAQGSATAANTSAGQASTYANNASQSATNAAGSASSASSSAGVAATAQSAAQATADRLFPKEINPSTLASFSVSGGYVVEGPNSSWPQPYMLTSVTGGGKYIQHKVMHSKIVGQRMRLTFWAYTYSDKTRVAIGLNQTNNADGTGGVGANVTDFKVPADCTAADATGFTSQQFVKFGYEWTITSGTQAFIVPYIYMNSQEGGAPTTGNDRTHICGFIWEDITSEAAAQSAASAAATSASSAAASNTAAGQQASAAQQSATNANTYAGQAQTYASNASTSASNAAGSATTASQQAGVATSAATNSQTYRDQGQGYANAAAGSASTASSKATEAGQSASAASASATAANTSAGNANTYANNASASATNAQGSANSAASSAGVSATARDAAQAARDTAQAVADASFPKSFTQQTLASFVYDAAGSSLAGPSGDWPQPYLLTYSDGVGHTVRHKARHAKIAGQRIRVTGWVYSHSPNCRAALYVAQSTGPDEGTGLTGLNADNVTTPAGCVGSDLHIPANQFVKLGVELTIRSDSAAFIVPNIYMNASEFGSAGSDATSHFCGFIYEDVTSEYAATVQATAAATSASNAAASQTGAAQQASAANQQATNAQTFAGQASGSAGQASTSASNAAGSAQAASSSATLSASAKDASYGVLGLQYPSSLDPTSRNAWVCEGNLTFEGPATDWPGGSYSIHVNANLNTQIAVLGKYGIPPVVGERYRITAYVWTEASNLYGTLYLGANDVQNDWYSGNPRGSSSTATVAPGCIDGATIVPQRTWTKVGSDVLITGVNSSFVRPLAVAYTGGNGLINGGTYLSAPVFQKITSEVSAQGFANAANTSASNASAAQTAAGNSATAANQAKLDAQAANGAAQSAANAASGSATSADASRSSAATYASQSASYRDQAAGQADSAHTQATNAQTFASQASASASSAASSATLSATINSTSAAINRNSKFQAWPDGSATPTAWSYWALEGGGTITRDTSRQSGGYAALMNGSANANLGLFANIYLLSGWQILTATVWLQSGTWQGAGVYVDGQTQLNFASDKDTANNIGATGGGIRTFSKLINVTGNTGDVHIYAMNNWDGFGQRDAKVMQWMECSVRPASDPEVQAQAATSAISTMSALITDTRSTVATLQSQAATVEQRLLAGQPNLLPNSTFDSGLAYWNAYTPPGTNIGSGLSGAWGYTFYGSGNYTGGAAAILQSYKVAVYANNYYTVSGDMILFANTGAAYAYMDIIFVDASGNVLPGGDGGQVNMYASQDFSPNASKRLAYAHSDVAPNGTTHAIVRFIIDAGGGTITNFGIRRVKLELGSTMSAYTAEASAAYQAGVLADHTGKLQSYIALTTSAGATQASVKLVATDGNGGTYSSVAIEAQEITLSNTVGSIKKTALSLVNGEATFSGKLNVRDPGGTGLSIVGNLITLYDNQGRVVGQIGTMP